MFRKTLESTILCENGNNDVLLVLLNMLITEVIAVLISAQPLFNRNTQDHSVFCKKKKCHGWGNDNGMCRHCHKIAHLLGTRTASSSGWAHQGSLIMSPVQCIGRTMYITPDEVTIREISWMWSRSESHLLVME